MFAEEGVNGAHQDPQYNVLYRNINMIRSFVDAAEAKRVMAWADIAKIDGAHNANATAREAWKVMPGAYGTTCYKLNILCKSWNEERKYLSFNSTANSTTSTMYEVRFTLCCSFKRIF